MDKVIVNHEIDEMFFHLQEAYNYAGILRDRFTGVGGYEQPMKEICNKARGNIGQLQGLKSHFKKMVELTESE